MAVVMEDAKGVESRLGKKTLHLGRRCPPIIVIALAQQLSPRQSVEKREIPTASSRLMPQEISRRHTVCPRRNRLKALPSLST
jgi:hypothetical protein